MDETSLRALLERAVAEEPPAGPIVASSVAAGFRLRRRRRVRATAVFAAFAAVIVAAGVTVPGLRTGSGPELASAVSIPPTLWVTAEFSGGPVSRGRGHADLGRHRYRGAADRDRGVRFDHQHPGREDRLHRQRQVRWVRAISTVAGTAGRPVRVKPGPVAMAITPDGKTLYVASAGNHHGPGWVTPISVATGKAEPPIAVATAPSSMAITPNGKTLYVLDIGGPARTVTPITVATNTARSPITVGPAPAVLAITPDGKTLYVADVEGTVTPISVATDTAGPPVTVAQNPGEIVITPDSKRAYVLSGSGSQDGTVTPIVTATNTAGTAVTIAGTAYGRMVLAP